MMYLTSLGRFALFLRWTDVAEHMFSDNGMYHFLQQPDSSHHVTCTNISITTTTHLVCIELPHFLQSTEVRHCSTEISLLSCKWLQQSHDWQRHIIVRTMNTDGQQKFLITVEAICVRAYKHRGFLWDYVTICSTKLFNLPYKNADISVATMPPPCYDGYEIKFFQNKTITINRYFN